mmetsp:Transcript_15655/g.42401  ORF Transcript_15655/g.42401 Transcript_15655/m.42401 type:complete len:273 (-) Transcript_15655:2882-3700(-)
MAVMCACSTPRFLKGIRRRSARAARFTFPRTEAPCNTRSPLRLGAGSASARASSYNSHPVTLRNWISPIRVLREQSVDTRRGNSRVQDVRGRVRQETSVQGARCTRNHAHRGITARTALHKRSRAPRGLSPIPAASSPKRVASSAPLAKRARSARPSRYRAKLDASETSQGRGRAIVLGRAVLGTFVKREARAARRPHAPRGLSTRRPVDGMLVHAWSASADRIRSTVRIGAVSAPKVTIARTPTLLQAIVRNVVQSEALIAAQTPRWPRSP